MTVATDVELAAAATRRLETVLCFTRADLELNRHGRLSDAQTQLLLGAYRPRTSNNQLLWMAGFMFVIGLTLWLLLRAARLDPLADMLACYFALGVVLPMYVWLKTRTFFSQADEPRVYMADGVAQRGTHVRAHPARGGEIVAYFVCIGSSEFRAPESVTHAFDDGRRYRVYFAQLRDRRPLVAAELLEL